MIKFLRLCLFLLFPVLVIAQHKPQITKPADNENAAQKTAVLTVAKIDVPAPSVEVGFPTTIPAKPKERIERFISSEFEEFKKNTELIYRNPTGFPTAAAPVNPIRLKFGVESNRGDRTAPLDNTVSASNADYVVSITNGFIEFYYNNTVPIYRASFSTFLGNKLRGPCDPKVIFDPIEKKFIIFAQRCDEPYGPTGKSEIMLGFSSSANPMEKWNFYILNGNPLNRKDDWFDYPKIGITKDGLFVSGHIFNADNPYFTETVVYQVDKDLGFQGKSLEYIVWHTFADRPSVLQPTTYAFNDLNSNGVFLVGTSFLEDANYIRLYDISGKIRLDPKIKLYKVPTTPYHYFAYAVQQDQEIDNGDTRMQDAVLFDNKIAFVFTSGDKDTFFSKVNLSVLDLSTLKIQSKLLGDHINYSYAYPSIGLLSDQNEPASLFVLYNGTSNTTFPDIRYKTCDASLNCGAEWILRRGESLINDGYDRWGDYSGVSKNRAKKGELWLSSSYGKYNTRQTYLANVVSSSAVGNPTAIIAVPLSIENVSFEVYTGQTVDVTLKKDGKDFKTYKQSVTNGKNIFQIVTENLEKGIYQIEIFSEEKKLIGSAVFTKN